jgi:hypothetical protein
MDADQYASIRVHSKAQVGQNNSRANFATSPNFSRYQSVFALDEHRGEFVLA